MSDDKMEQIARNAIDLAREANDAARDVIGIAERTWEQRKEEFAHNLFNYNITVASRLALGHGIERSDVAAWLRDLAYAIETQDVAEDMSAIDDNHTLEHLIQ
jgi:hypothetical protein